MTAWLTECTSSIPAVHDGLVAPEENKETENRQIFLLIRIRDLVHTQLSIDRGILLLYSFTDLVLLQLFD